jgi:hypothetical protein
MHLHLTVKAGRIGVSVIRRCCRITLRIPMHEDSLAFVQVSNIVAQDMKHLVGPHQWRMTLR